MKEAKHLQKLIDCYNHTITEKEFVEYLKNDEKLQKIFNKELKKFNFGDDVVPTLFESANRIGTDSEVFFDDTKIESISKFVIYDSVKKLLVKKYFGVVPKEEVDQILMIDITNEDCFYNADGNVENFIKKTILETMPKFDSYKSALKYVKEQLKEVFPCEKKMPDWLQNCEWAFSKSGKPMKFIRQEIDKKDYSYNFIFEDVDTKIIKIINQHD